MSFAYYTYGNKDDKVDPITVLGKISLSIVRFSYVFVI